MDKRLRYGLALLIFVLALVPRITTRTHTNADESAHWVGRSEQFLDALRTGDIEQTAQAFHPGVITMWSGALGIIIEEARFGPEHSDHYEFNIRIIYSLLSALSIPISFLLLIRLFSLNIALIVSILWAFDPYLIEHGSILHVDGLSTSFMFISFLLGLVALKLDEHPYRYHIDDQIRWRWWIASAVFGGLATLTKFTSLSVIGILGMLALVLNYRRISWRRIYVQIWPFIAWGLIALVVIFALYPALWGLHFDAVFARLDRGFEAAFEGHFNFFLGEQTIQPGPLYYLVGVLYRVTPFVLIGVLISPVALWANHQKRYQERMMGLFLYVVLFTALMLIQRKQQERYLLPIFPVLLVFAAFGLEWLAKRAAPLVARFTPPRPIYGYALLTALVIGLWAIYHPYLRAYYNPLLGGGATAVEIIRVGSGEGLDQAADWIESREDDPCSLGIVSPYSAVVEDALPCTRITDMGQWPQGMPDADYAFFYISHQQRGFYGILDEAFETLEPVYTVWIQSIPYVEIYDLRETPPDIDYSILEEAGYEIRQGN
jgi:hypothetical protein